EGPSDREVRRAVRRVFSGVRSALEELHNLGHELLVVLEDAAVPVWGTDPLEAPKPRLSKVMTWRWVGIPSMTRGSQSSSTAPRWCRKTSGTPPRGPSAREAKVTPPASSVWV